MRWVLVAYLAALSSFCAIAVAGAVVVVDAMGSEDPVDAAIEEHGFNVVRWELENLPEKWLYDIGDALPFHSNRKGEGTDDAILERYFNLVDELNGLDPESEEYSRLEHERGWLENTAESIIEGRVRDVLHDEGLTMGPPPFTDLDIVFPPVDFEFNPPPRVLAVSPRDRIALVEDALLTPGLKRTTAEEIEAEAETDGDVSALVIGAGGVATYPSIITDDRAYDDLIDTVFHEWIHQNLVFYPLGSRYFQGSELRTLNETVASVAGRELAVEYFERYGHLDQGNDDAEDAAPLPSDAPTPAATTEPEDEFDFTKEMRALRVEVEEMLAAGEIEEAEALMDEKRDEFEAEGYFIRKLNQAYFAFHGFYGDSPASVDPIGPKVQAVYEQVGSAGAFVRAIRGITSEAGLNALVGE